MDIDKLEKFKPWILRITIALALFLCGLYVFNAYYPLFDLYFSIFTILYLPMIIIRFIASCFISVMYVSPWQIYLSSFLLFSGQMATYIWIGKKIENWLEKYIRKKNLLKIETPQD